MREVESEVSFYREVTKIILSEEEIVKLKESSKYDAEKREYTVPLFVLKD